MRARCTAFLSLVVVYEVYICTGRRPGAGTESNVFINLIGSRGDLGNRSLHQSQNNKVKFQQGQVDIFSIEAVPLGKLKKILIGHDGTGPDLLLLKKNTSRKSSPFSPSLYPVHGGAEHSSGCRRLR
ncbi:PREDICTED: lipoxygenase homology domain-containing protein 1-like [Myotis brandtii]|uniref:lipoxygenase homology domain-containing protein 1-like n=1 Tax=Myotis brandtii TaxID=109478 RepID=UPI0007047011|nr:PREDICTED: lipoxygenase homology domain-containing protein 1-like [Myotis brandtii]